MKNSIKRAQSQACLGFAERKNFRPLAKLKKLSLTLALLITAATSAWADWTGGTYTATTNENLGAITVSTDATLTINEGVTVTVSGGINANGHTLTVNGAGTLTVNGTNGANGANTDTFYGGGGGIGSAGFTGTLIVDGATVNVTGGNGGNGGSGVSDGGNGGNGAAGVSGSITLNSGSATVTGGAGGNGGHASTPDGLNGSRGSAGQAVTETITASTVEESDDNSTWTAISGNTSSKRYVRAESTAPAGPTVTINDTKTEASFEMPQYDVTASYTLKRDMSVDMPVTVKDAEQNSRFRVQKQGNSFVPVGLTTEQIVALFKVHDDIESKDLTAITDYTVQIFAADEDGDATGTAMTFATFTYAPGRYVAKAVAVDGSNYSGETALSNVFTLFQGYEVTVPAGEYITYYKDEALYVEDTEAQLYTITAVNGDKATATELTVAAAKTPLLVKNNAETEKTILLIPTTNTADNVTAANEFKGTKEATTIAASTATQNNYALNGKEFVWVKNDIAIAANKAWLSISGSGPSNTRSISIVFDSETTGIDGVSGTAETGDGNWYDLNGRKFTTKPTKKGVYIMNGKKVVIKN